MIKKILMFSQKKAIPTSLEIKLFKKTFQISGETFPSSENTSYISRKGTFWPQAKKLIYLF